MKMKKFLAIVTILALSAFVLAQDPRIPLPTCDKITQTAKYISMPHLEADVCINGFGFRSLEECQDYALGSNHEELKKEIEAFLQKRKIEVCGE